MGNDISAVKAQVEEIVASSSPELYILSQFNDPSESATSCFMESKDAPRLLMLNKAIKCEVIREANGDYC